MIYFNCDYNEGAHPAVLQRLVETNLEQSIGYGNDAYCDAARELIQQKCQQPEAYVQFLVGGTQANLTVIASILRPHQGVLCADSGHINVHETGSIEATGHKVLALPATDGKVTAKQVRDAVLDHWRDGSFEHMVQPGMVYISFSTETGTLYSKKELTDLYEACQEMNIPLFIDGARLGYGLTAPENDLTLPELAALCDVFTIGGTKCGALFGEAVVITNRKYQRDFRYIVKQRGGMLAKGRLLGLQFCALMENDLYFEICSKAVQQALAIREAMLAKGFALFADAPANQQFFTLPNAALKKLEEKYVLEHMGAADHGHTNVRVCTSWATTDENVNAFIADVAAL